MNGLLVVWTAIVAFLQLPFMQVALAVVFIGLIGWVSVRWPKVKKINDWAKLAYLYAEEQGLLNSLKGFEKWEPFRNKLTELCKIETGKEPTPEIIGTATKHMEKLVQEEHL